MIQVIEQPYTTRQARIHVRHVKDLLKSLDASDAYNGIEGASLAFLNVVTQGDILGTLSFLCKYFNVYKGTIEKAMNKSLKGFRISE